MHVYGTYLKSERTAALLYALALFLFAFFIVVVFPSIAKIKALKDYLEMLPPFLKAFIGQEAIEFTRLEGFLAVEFFNTTWLLITGVFTCLFAGSLVAEETEKKTLEILMSTPLRRVRFVAEKFAGFMTLLAFLTAASFAGIWLGALRIHENIDAALYISVFFTGFVCMSAIGSAGLFISCLVNEQRRAAGLTLLVFFALYFFNLISALLDQYPALRYLSLFHYFDASRFFTGNAVSAADLLVLAAVFVLTFTASLVSFHRKEIYV
ncbi:MAG: ABC transporter permease subunit [bacterium]